MSPRISRIYPLLLALCLLLPSCTLLDNDLRPESEKQEAAPDTPSLGRQEAPTVSQPQQPTKRGCR